MKVVFQNHGLIDLRAISTFGVSAKETANPIGFFGTGLKYAIAIILREGLGLRLYVDGEKYEFKKQQIQMRGKNFEIITMNGKELPYTVDLGKNWKLWQAYRELYCNSVDEGGSVILIGEPTPEGLKDRTVFVVDGEKFIDCHRSKNQFFLDIPEHLKILDGNIEVYNKPSSAIFYRGIRVYELEKPSLLTYNYIDNIDLTEDRTMAYPYYEIPRLVNAVSKIEDKNIIREVLLAENKHLESEFNYSNLNANGNSQAFEEVLEEEFARNNDKLSHSAAIYYAHKKDLTAQKVYEEYELTDVEAKQLERAKQICATTFSDFSDYGVLIVKDLGNKTMAIAESGENRMVLSRRCFHYGTKFLVSTMIEEYTHLKTGHSDESRPMQTHLFDTICTLIEHHVIKEPI